MFDLGALRNATVSLYAVVSINKIFFELVLGYRKPKTRKNPEKHKYFFANGLMQARRKTTVQAASLLVTFWLLHEKVNEFDRSKSRNKRWLTPPIKSFSATLGERAGLPSLLGEYLC